MLDGDGFIGNLLCILLGALLLVCLNLDFIRLPLVLDGFFDLGLLNYN